MFLCSRAGLLEEETLLWSISRHFQHQVTLSLQRDENLRGEEEEKQDEKKEKKNRWSLPVLQDGSQLLSARERTCYHEFRPQELGCSFW